MAKCRFLHRLKMVHYHLRVRLPEMIRGGLAGNAVKAYWFRDIVNFGDLITPLLLKEYGFTPVHTPPHKADFVSTGSILEHLPESFRGVILGSGFIYEDSQLHFPGANILSVRGELSKRILGPQRVNLQVGDPGLLAGKVLKVREEKRYRLGIVPHHIHLHSPLFRQIVAQHAGLVTLIDVRQQPLEVFRAIDQCESLLSSSLHGLIAADSLGISNGWLAAEGLTGGRFKFDDYYSSLHIVAGEPVQLSGDESLVELLALTSLKPEARIKALQADLDELWSTLKDRL